MHLMGHSWGIRLADLKNYAFVYQADGSLKDSPLYDCMCIYDPGRDTPACLGCGVR